MSRPAEISRSTLRRRQELAAGGTSDLFGAVDNGAAEQVAAALEGLPEQRRREIGVELTAWFKQRGRDTWWSQGTGTALAVAVVGCLPTAAQAAAILGRSSVNPHGRRAAELVRAVAQDRGVDWLVDLALRMAARFGQDSWVGRWHFVATLLHAEGAAPPTDDRSVQLWLTAVDSPDRFHRGQPAPVVDRLRDDPFLAAMLPRLFEVDGIGTQMMFIAAHQNWNDPGPPAVPAALARLATEGVVDRAMLLDGAIGRLLRGDRPAALRAFTTLLDQLAPTTAEVTARTTDYLRLLTDAPAPVATMAQKALRKLPEVELESLLEMSRQVLLRPDKALVKAQLSWLDRLARQHRDRAGQIAEVIAVAAGHPAIELRERAVALAARHGVDPATGDGAPARTRPRGDDLPPPPALAPAAEPVTELDELVEEVAALLGTPYQGAPLERVLDGLVRLTATDGARVRAALDPVIERRHWSWAGEHRWDPLCLCETVVEVLKSAGVRRPDRRRDRWEKLLASIRRSGPAAPELLATDPRVPPVHRLLRARLAEIGARLDTPGHPGLVAAPTATNGLLDPLALLERLAALGDREPGYWDLTQALLRLPAGTDQTIHDKAAALGTPAGQRFAAWLRDGGLPQPVMRARTLTRDPRRSDRHWEYAYLPAERVTVELHPPDGHVDRYGLLTAPATHLVGDHYGWVHLWPSLLPGHRGVVTAYALPLVAAAADMDQRDGTTVLPLLAEAGGPGGVALDLAVAYGLGARHAPDRVATVDALLALAAAGDLDATGTGAQLGTLAARQLVKLTRVVEPLRDAAQAGAPLTVWRLLAATLPAVLTAPTPTRGIGDLLTLAAETATATGVRIEVPGLADVAGRGGSSRLVTEARRLHRALQEA
ncbi:hypothetical protein SAMN05443287_102362 [Micromonospora phaseoli]|uniref:Secreted protein n=1 Tax=Micromonospora phaseoli TaxID=1144548 RepID=A0A1H6URQ1_9ACTN|nr:DUF6493 family protein [Micromonospora phaseoli]PZV99126.1 hypothetical protein CLV64_104363 [Micromonospora phaseoli]GIJ78672.1 hypothetical protein Xph01_31040 [Micromonospora phaseoli]SEI94999.1 hypothetical protein SAMN05443287_102362 [Micromonospora phaseoli]